MAPKVPTKESGTTTLGIRVARRLRRNAKTTSTTRNTLMSKVRSTSRTDARMVPARSTATWMSMAGETVFDPFSGLGTVAYRALKLQRKGYGVELAPRYFADSIAYCHAAEQEIAIPTLFDMKETPEDATLETASQAMA